MAAHTHLIISSLTILSSALLLALPSYAADPDPKQDFCVADLNSQIYIDGYPCKNPSQVTSADFFYQGFLVPPTTYDKLGVNLTEGTVKQFPGLNTLGKAMNRLSFLPGGLNPPHIHPRATELSLVTQGQLLVGWVSTEYVLYSKVVSTGELFVIPPGLVHYQLNVGTGNAVFFASFNSQNPGLQKIGDALFGSKPPNPDAVLSKALQVNDSVIQLIRAKLS